MSIKRKIVSLVIFIASVCCLLYPVISGFLNNYEQNYAIEEYETIVSEKKDYSDEIKKCKKYNNSLINNPGRFTPSTDESKEYNSLLDIAEGLMGFLEIPKINLKVPIYHHTDIRELSNGAGHVEGTSLPIGGLGTHSAIAGHTGMASQMMFTDLTELEVGDKFYIRVLDETLTYEVDKIELVLPSDTSLLKIEPDKDYVTLITCYPLGVGSHRLLVRGHNIGIDTEKAEEQIINTPKILTKTNKIYLVLLIVAIISTICYAIVFFLKMKKDSKKYNNEKNLSSK